MSAPSLPGTEVTRSRAYRKNDQAFVEQSELAADLVRRQVAVIAATSGFSPALAENSNHDNPHRLRHRPRPGPSRSGRKSRAAGRKYDGHQFSKR
jgi:hypothetical protein